MPQAQLRRSTGRGRSLNGRARSEYEPPRAPAGDAKPADRRKNAALSARPKARSVMTLSRRLKGRRRSPPDAGETQPGAGRAARTSPAASTSPECRYSRDRLESRYHLLPCQEEVLEDERRSLGHLGRKSFFNWRR